MALLLLSETVTQLKFAQVLLNTPHLSALRG